MLLMVPKATEAMTLGVNVAYHSNEPSRMLMIALAPQKIDAETFYEGVEHRLCDLGQLVARQFPTTKRELRRNGKVCGIYFCVHGPRSVKLTAIVDFEKKLVIYYGSDGIRRESEPIAMNVLTRQAA